MWDGVPDTDPGPTTSRVGSPFRESTSYGTESLVGPGASVTPAGSTVVEVVNPTLSTTDHCVPLTPPVSPGTSGPGWHLRSLPLPELPAFPGLFRVNVSSPA